MWVSVMVGSVGLAAGGSASPLLAASMTHGDALLGLPLGVLVMGSAVGALSISWRSTTAGRAASLSAGYAAGALGAIVVVAGAAEAEFAVVLLGCLLMGAANAAVFLSRYAAAELAPPDRRGRAVASTLFAATFGAVAGPNLLAPAGHLATLVRLPAPAGLFLIAAPSFALASWTVARIQSPASPRPAVSVRRRLRRRSTLAALAVLAAANLAMVAIMAVAPVRMHEMGRSLGFVGLMVSGHIAAMFAPAPFTGFLADRVGGRAVCTIGLLVLAVATAVGGIAGFSTTLTMALFLIGVGVGWNTAVIGGSTMLVDSLPVELRPHGEGIGEVAMGLAATAGAPGAGLVVVLGGFRALALGATLVALVGVAAIAGARTISAQADSPTAAPVI